MMLYPICLPATTPTWIVAAPTADYRPVTCSLVGDAVYFPQDDAANLVRQLRAHGVDCFVDIKNGVPK